MEDNLHSFHLYVIQAENRDKLISFLSENGVQTLIHYPVPVHKQNCYKEYRTASLPKTKKYSKNILSLPIHPFITEQEILEISTLIKRNYK